MAVAATWVFRVMRVGQRVLVPVPRPTMGTLATYRDVDLLPAIVAKVTKTQFTTEDNRRFRRVDGAEINPAYRYSYLRAQHYRNKDDATLYREDYDKRMALWRLLKATNSREMALHLPMAKVVQLTETMESMKAIVADTKDALNECG